MRLFIISLFFFCFSLSFYSCKKDTRVVPLGKFVLPASGQTFISKDTLYYTVEYTHDRPITELVVRITVSGGTVFLSSNVINPNNNEGSVSGELFLSSGNFTDGFYSLELSLSDGELESRTFRQIYISQFSKLRESIWVSYENAALQYKTEMLDSVGFVMQNNGIHLFTLIDSDKSLLYTCGKNQGDLKAYDLRNGVIKWTIQNPGGGVGGYFRGGFLDKHLIYVSREDGFITAYDDNKAVRYNATLNLGEYAECFLLSNNLVVAEKKTIPPSLSFISVYNLNGTGRHEIIAGNTIEIVSMFAGQTNDIWVFANQGTGRIGKYDMLNNFITWLYTMPSGQILAVEQQLHSKYWVSTDNAGIQEFRTGNNSLTPFNNALTPQGIIYEPVVNELFVWNNNSIQVLNPLTGIEIRNHSAAGNIKGINFLYNRD